VRVEPDEAEAFAALRERDGSPGNRTCRDGMIATDRQRHRASNDRIGRDLRELSARGRDGRQERAHRAGHIARAMKEDFRQRCRDVVVLLDDMSQCLEAPGQVRHAQRRRSHVHSATARPEIHGNAGDSYSSQNASAHMT
jgi:hypothetical protein